MVRVSGNPGAAIPEEIIQILRSRLGSQYRLTDTFNESVSKEAIRKFEQNDRLNRELIEPTRGAAQLQVWRDSAGWTVTRAEGR